MNSLKILLEKRNYLRVTDNAGPIYNEDVSPYALAKVRKYLDLIDDELRQFSYTVSIPDQPRLLKELESDISYLLTMMDTGVSQKNSVPIDKKWIESGIYGKMSSLNTILYFRIGDTQTTVAKPLLKDINATMETLINDSNKNGLKVFSNSSDYRVFIQRSFSEISNILNDWGGFDPDLGVKVTFIIVGDGKNDPEGKYENVTEYDKNLLSGLKEAFDLKKDGKSAPAALAAITSIDVKFCVPQKRYNTDILDTWSKLLQKGPSGSGQAFYYYMFESLKQNGRFTPDSVKKLLE